MGELAKLPNISTIIEAKLIDAGVKTVDQLKELGSKEAFRKIKVRDPKACVNMLCAIEGAVQGIRWFNLPEEKKKDLADFYDTL